MYRDECELCGFLEAKTHVNFSSPKEIINRFSLWRKRGLWKRVWISVKKLQGTGIEVSLDKGPTKCSKSFQIFEDAEISRCASKSRKYAFSITPGKVRFPKRAKFALRLSANSETKAQQWMDEIRQLLRPRNLAISNGAHYVSIVDNAHSKSAGLTCLYGDLKATPESVTIKDINTGETIADFNWSELGQVHFANHGFVEDVEKIVVVHTKKNFRCGVGELSFFCHTEPKKLLKDLASEGRGQRQPKFLPRVFEDYNTIVFDKTIVLPLLCPIKPPTFQLLDSPLTDHESPCKYEKRVTLSDLVEKANPFRSTRKISDVSEDSGIDVELNFLKIGGSSEIEEETIYEEIPNLGFEKQFEKATTPPPPLPPRRNFDKTATMPESSRSDQGYYSETDICSDEVISSLASEEISKPKNIESDYMTMSPRFRDLFIAEMKKDESEYVFMAPRYNNLFDFRTQNIEKDEDIYVVME